MSSTIVQETHSRLLSAPLTPSSDAEGHYPLLEKMQKLWKAFESTLTPGMKVGIVVGSAMQLGGFIPIVGQIIQAVGLVILFLTLVYWGGKLGEDLAKPTVQEVIDKIRDMAKMKDLPRVVGFDSQMKKQRCIRLGSVKTFITNLNYEFHLTKEDVYQFVDQLMDFGLKRSDCEDLIYFMDPKVDPNYLNLDEISSKEHEKIHWQSDELHKELFETDIESVIEAISQLEEGLGPKEDLESTIQVVPNTPEMNDASSPDVPETPTIIKSLSTYTLS